MIACNCHHADLTGQRRTPGQRINVAIDYMLRNQHKPLRVSDLGSVAMLSNSRFFSVFKAETGFSPMEFFIRLRMLRSCELLMNQSLPIKQVAALSGYKDASYFSRLFKSVNGVSPLHYRRIAARTGCAARAEKLESGHMRVSERVNLHMAHEQTMPIRLIDK